MKTKLIEFAKGNNNIELNSSKSNELGDLGFLTNNLLNIHSFY